MNNDTKHCPFCSKEISQEENICRDCRIKINPHCEEAHDQKLEPTPIEEKSQPEIEQNSNFVDKVFGFMDFLYRPRYIGGRPSSRLETSAYFIIYTIAVIVFTGIMLIIGGISGPKSFIEYVPSSMVIVFCLTIPLYIKAMISACSSSRIMLLLFLAVQALILFVG